MVATGIDCTAGAAAFDLPVGTAVEGGNHKKLKVTDKSGPPNEDADWGGGHQDRCQGPATNCNVGVSAALCDSK